MFSRCPGLFIQPSTDVFTGYDNSSAIAAAFVHAVPLLKG